MKKAAIQSYYPYGDWKLQNICDQILHAASRDYGLLSRNGLRAQTLLAVGTLRDAFSEYPSENEVSPVLACIRSEFETAEAQLNKQLQDLFNSIGRQLGSGTVHAARFEVRQVTSSEELYRAAKRVHAQASALLEEELITGTFQGMLSELKRQIENFDTLLTALKTAQMEYRLATLDKVEMGNNLYLQLLSLASTCIDTLHSSEYQQLYQKLQVSDQAADVSQALQEA